MDANNKIIAVTGGGNGIGREIVLHLLKRGAKVAAADINAKGLSETAALKFPLFSPAPSISK